MKKCLAIILCFALAVSCSLLFSACDKDGLGDSEPATIVGEWKTTVNFGKIFEGEIMDEILGNTDDVPEEILNMFDFSKLSLVVNMSFKDTGEYEVSLDQESVDKMTDALLEMLSNAMKEFVKEMLQGQGVSLEEYLQQQGTTWEKLMEESFPRDEMLEDLDVSETGEYKIVDNKLYFDDEEEGYFVFTLTSKKLTITEIVHEDMDDEETQEIMKALLPWEFTRK